MTFSATGMAADGRTLQMKQAVLDNAPTNFERGRTDTFQLRAVDLGTLKHARVWLNIPYTKPATSSSTFYTHFR